MVPDRSLATLREISASERVLFRVKEGEDMPFGGECQIIGLSESGFWVCFEGGHKRFFWRLDIDGLEFDDVAAFGLTGDLKEELPPTITLAPRLLINAPCGNQLFLATVP